MPSLKDQVAVVTGAGSGIGRAVALGLAARGAKTCLVGRDRSKLEGVVAAAGAAAGLLTVQAADLELDGDIETLGRTVHDRFGGLDILVHAAGTITLARHEQAALGDLDRQFRVNVRAPYLMTKVFLPSLKSRRGQVVFINSSAGLQAHAGAGQYGATKHALKAVADSLREEVNDDGVRVLSVYPGRTATPMQESVHTMENRVYRPQRLMQPEDVADVIINALEMPMTAEVTDIQIRNLKKLS